MAAEYCHHKSAIQFFFVCLFCFGFICVLLGSADRIQSILDHNTCVSDQVLVFVPQGLGLVTINLD